MSENNLPVPRGSDIISRTWVEKATNHVFVEVDGTSYDIGEKTPDGTYYTPFGEDIISKFGLSERLEEDLTDINNLNGKGRVSVPSPHSSFGLDAFSSNDRKK